MLKDKDQKKQIAACEGFGFIGETAQMYSPSLVEVFSSKSPRPACANLLPRNWAAMPCG